MNGNAQNNVFVKKDSSKTFSMSFNFSSQTKQNNSLSLNIQNKPAHFTLFYDTLYDRRILYDNYSQQYFYKDPLMPYHTFQGAIFGGSINYLLLLLFDKKK
jgi:hypothetical protein